MKNKGFTLVELLAVIAILAILVIVAMPNVLGMFNQAKVNSFVTEVQKIMDTATTTFTKDALINSGKTVYYSSESNATLGTKKLDMSGNEKNYFIEMDRNGEFKRVVVYDSNYCYDIYTTNSIVNENLSKSKFIFDGISKTSVVASDVWEAANDNIVVNTVDSSYVLKGCEAIITVDGKNYNQIVERMKINNVEYEFVPTMTWFEWLNTDYNKLGYKDIDSHNVFSVDSTKTLRYGTKIYAGDDTVFTNYAVTIKHEILKSEEYHFLDRYLFFSNPAAGILYGEYYYDFTTVDDIKYGLELKYNTVDGLGSLIG